MLTEKGTERLQEILDATTDVGHKLNSWERGFLDDQRERFEAFGGSIFMSRKQWDVLEKIYAKVA